MTETSNRVPLALLASKASKRSLQAPAYESPALHAEHPPVDPYRPTDLTSVCTDGNASFSASAYDDATVIYMA